MALGPDGIDRVGTAPWVMPMLIWNVGGAPPFGPGTAASVDAATWFQWITAPASASTGGAADAP